MAQSSASWSLAPESSPVKVSAAASPSPVVCKRGTAWSLPSLLEVTSFRFPCPQCCLGIVPFSHSAAGLGRDSQLRNLWHGPHSLIHLLIPTAVCPTASGSPRPSDYSFPSRGLTCLCAPLWLGTRRRGGSPESQDTKAVQGKNKKTKTAADLFDLLLVTNTMFLLQMQLLCFNSYKCYCLSLMLLPQV